MNQNTYELTKLLPQFDLLLDGDFTSAAGLSAAVVLFLVIATTVFALLSIWNYWRASSHLRFYRSLLEGVTSEQLLEKQREISNKAIQNKKYGQLWHEFDESLVHVPHRDRLFNTLDAGHFFNTHTIARGLTENRLLAAVPGFLTAIGVIGTFAGLQMGLAFLIGNSADPGGTGTSNDIDALKNGIFGMIGGASIAFMTSVWGVFTSVLFNFFEKILERSIRSSITSFQNQVDYLYPRITAEQSLSNIEDFTRQSSDRLAELDEKIGHRLQEAMRQASDSIRDGLEQSLTSILGPAIEKLVNNAHSGSEKALETLLERFMDGVGSAGQAQKEMMEKAALNVQHASNSMAEGMGGFMAGLESQMQQMVKQNSSRLAEVQGTLIRQMEEQQNRDVARQSVLNNQLKSFQGSQDQLTQGLGAVLETQQQQHSELSQELKGLLQGFSELSSAHERAAGAMQQSSTEMKTTSLQMGVLSSNIKESSEHLGANVSASVQTLGQLTERNSAMVDLYQGLIEQMRTVNTRIEETAGMMSRAAETAGTGLASVDTHFKQLGQSLREHVEQLEKQIANLLSEYSDRVKHQTGERLNVWNEQTNTYIGAMTSAVQTLNDVVDEIDNKVRK